MFSRKDVEIDLASNAILNFCAKVQQEKGLSNTDLERAATKALLEIKNAKSVDDANMIQALLNKIKECEKESRQPDRGDE